MPLPLVLLSCRERGNWEYIGKGKNDFRIVTCYSQIFVMVLTVGHPISLSSCRKASVDASHAHKSLN